jgi:hypothetical protein
MLSHVEGFAVGSLTQNVGSIRLTPSRAELAGVVMASLTAPEARLPSTHGEAPRGHSLLLIEAEPLSRCPGCRDDWGAPSSPARMSTALS